MPSNLVKSERDEEKWNEAKAYCRDEGLSENDGDRFWECVNGTYQRMTGDGKGGGSSDALALALGQWLTNYDA